MSDPPDMDALARRYLDLWQQSITEAAGDPDAARAMAAFFGQFKAFMPQLPPAAPAANGGDGRVLDALGRIEDRLDRIEARLDALERPPARKRPKKTKDNDGARGGAKTGSKR